MRLSKFNFEEFEGDSKRWRLSGLELGDRNLLVGRNSTGKSRAINTINSLAMALSGRFGTAVPQSGTWSAEFENGGSKCSYRLEARGGSGFSERFERDGEVLLEKGFDGKGRIYFEKLKIFVDLNGPPSIVFAFARQDAAQHSFLMPLIDWAANTRIYNFGGALGKEHLAFFQDGGPNMDERDQNQTVAILRAALIQFGTPFHQRLLDDLALVGYDVESVGFGSPNIALPNLPFGLSSILVKEKSLPGTTDQITMSQGMFRVVSLLIHIAFASFNEKSMCILIDDIGEGLDFDRSCRLIDLLRKRSMENGFQLVMSTNDKFVMNNVPLEEWSVLRRTGNEVGVANVNNARQAFESFKFTGLGNFAFLEMDVLGEPPTVIH